MSSLFKNVSGAAVFAAIVFCALGYYAISTQAKENRDIIRKHDIEDLEKALVSYEKLNGTYPPEDRATWCGVLSDSNNQIVKKEIEDSLRKDKKYAKADKLFPLDPVYKNTNNDYFYWKTSPVSFELLSKLEADNNNSRDTSPCGVNNLYDYSVVSTLRNPF